MNRFYFDSAASMPAFKGAMGRVASLGPLGNPSSPHADGVRARQLIQRTRRLISDYVGSDDPRQITFTSGATEAANLLIQGYVHELRARASQRREIIVSTIEHPAVYQTAYAMERWGFTVKELPVNTQGFVEVAALEAALGPQTAMVCVMAVNNETGRVQPINALAGAVKAIDPGVFFLCDAVQGFAKLPWDIDVGLVDALFMSGHKIGAEKGTGCFYLSRRFAIQPLFYGGQQEGTQRPGTENVRGIALLGEALNENLEDLAARLHHVKELEEVLLTGLRDAGVPFHRLGGGETCSPYILMLAFPDIPAKVLLDDLDALGFSLARGAACSSHQATPSRVLSAMSVKDSLSACAVRVSFSAHTQRSEVDSLLDCLIELCGVD